MLIKCSTIMPYSSSFIDVFNIQMDTASKSDVPMELNGDPPLGFVRVFSDKVEYSQNINANEAGMSRILVASWCSG